MRSSSTESGSGSELVRTTEAAIYIAKKSQKIRTVEGNNQGQLENVHEAQLLEYLRWIKPTSERTAKVLFPYMVYKYVLPSRHWTWRYITIANSQVFRLQLLGTH